MIDRIPILLDTDPGSDIDDALAIAYLASKPECELLGITTVSGNVVQRAAIAEVTARDFGLPDVPVVAGISEVLAYGIGQPNVPHYAAIADRPHRQDYEPNRAVDFLREQIRARPGEIILLTIGPMTNIATLFTLDPEIPSMLRGTVSMLGSFRRGYANEWNAAVDPAAAFAALRRSVNHLVIGLDVTLQCALEREAFLAQFGQGPLSRLLPMAEKWLAHSGSVIFHDPLAAAVIFRPEFCQFETGYITGVPDIDDHPRSGHLNFVPDPTGPHKIAVSVDVEAFFAEYFAVCQTNP